jgi:hypothetical protein
MTKEARMVRVCACAPRRRNHSDEWTADCASRSTDDHTSAIVAVRGAAWCFVHARTSSSSSSHCPRKRTPRCAAHAARPHMPHARHFAATTDACVLAQQAGRPHCARLHQSSRGRRHAQRGGRVRGMLRRHGARRRGRRGARAASCGAAPASSPPPPPPPPPPLLCCCRARCRCRRRAAAPAPRRRRRGCGCARRGVRGGRRRVGRGGAAGRGGDAVADAATDNTDDAGPAPRCGWLWGRRVERWVVVFHPPDERTCTTMCRSRATRRGAAWTRTRRRRARRTTRRCTRCGSRGRAAPPRAALRPPRAASSGHPARRRGELSRLSAHAALLRARAPRPPTPGRSVPAEAALALLRAPLAAARRTPRRRRRRHPRHLGGAPSSARAARTCCPWTRARAVPARRRRALLCRAARGRRRRLARGARRGCPERAPRLRRLPVLVAARVCGRSALRRAAQATPSCGWASTRRTRAPGRPWRASARQPAMTAAQRAPHRDTTRGGDA